MGPNCDNRKISVWSEIVLFFSFFIWAFIHFYKTFEGSYNILKLYEKTSMFPLIEHSYRS